MSLTPAFASKSVEPVFAPPLDEGDPDFHPHEDDSADDDDDDDDHNTDDTVDDNALSGRQFQILRSPNRLSLRDNATFLKSKNVGKTQAEKHTDPVSDTSETEEPEPAKEERPSVLQCTGR